MRVKALCQNWFLCTMWWRLCVETLWNKHFRFMVCCWSFVLMHSCKDIAQLALDLHVMLIWVSLCNIFVASCAGLVRSTLWHDAKVMRNYFSIFMWTIAQLAWKFEDKKSRFYFNCLMRSVFFNQLRNSIQK